MNVYLRLLLSYFLVTCTVLFTVEASEQNDQYNTNAAIEQYQGGNEVEAIRYLMQLAYEGNVAAQFNLGVISLNRGDDAIAVKEALFWFERAAKEGDTGAQFNLGMLLLHGADSAALSAAAGWLERAMEGGIRMAQVNLGILSLWWPGFPVDMAIGRKWIELAAADNDEVALTVLKLGDENTAAADALGSLYPLDTILRSEVNPSGSRIRRDSAPIYALPTGRQEPLETLSKDTEVEVIRKTSGWINVRTERGLPVWMMANMAEVTGNRATITRLEVGLYVKPEIDVEVYKIGSVTKGETFQILQKQQEWLLIEAPRRVTGWIREDDVEVRLSSLPLEAALAAGEQEENGIAAADSGGASTGSEKTSLTSLEIPSITGNLKSMQVVEETLVFSDSKPNASALGIAPEGTVLKVGQDVEGFSLAAEVPLRGWIHAQLITQGPDSGFINYPGARVRTKPDLSGQVITIYQLGQEVTVIEQIDNWYKIELEVHNGWIQTAQLTPAKIKDQSRSLQEVMVAQENEVGALSGAEQSSGATMDNWTEVSIPADTVLYSAASKKSQSLGRLLERVNVKRFEDREEMIRISFPTNTYAWVYAALVSQDGNSGTVKRDSVRIRLDPDTSLNNIVRLHNKGDDLNILERVEDWYRISLGAHQGWIAPLP
ncbi:MAG: SH3 domain-containing protein [Arenicellales bacterium]